MLSDPAAGGPLHLWVTAEGDFTDPRRARCGCGRASPTLRALLPDAVLVPLALEYSFWNESKPEALLRFGAPLSADAGALRAWRTGRPPWKRR